MKKHKHICTACQAVKVPVHKSFGNGLSGDVCPDCGSEDVFPYETEKEMADHKAACAEDKAAKETASENRARRRALDGDY